MNEEIINRAWNVGFNRTVGAAHQKMLDKEIIKMSETPCVVVDTGN